MRESYTIARGFKKHGATTPIDLQASMTFNKRRNTANKTRRYNRSIGVKGPIQGPTQRQAAR